MTDFNISIFLVLYYRTLDADAVQKAYYRIDDSTLSGLFQEGEVSSYDDPIWKSLAGQCARDFNRTIFENKSWKSDVSNKEFYEPRVAAACSAKDLEFSQLVRVKAKMYPWSEACDAAHEAASAATIAAATHECPCGYY